MADRLLDEDPWYTGLGTTEQERQKEYRQWIDSQINQIETVGRKSAGGSGWKWIVGIVGIIVVIWIFNTGEQYTNRSPNTSPTPRSFESRPSRSTLAGEIENGKTRAKQMEVQINEMDNRLEDYERRMKSYRASGMTDDYNMLVPSFNLLVGERNDLYQQYSSLIDEVNSKVKRYNSGYR